MAERIDGHLSDLPVTICGRSRQVESEPKAQRTPFLGRGPGCRPGGSWGGIEGPGGYSRLHGSEPYVQVGVTQPASEKPGRRITGHGAFFGLLAGTLAAALHHGLTLPAGATVGIKGGWLVGGHVLHTYPVDMAQNFWMAIYAWTTCLVVTTIVSLATQRNKSDDELRGLVYSLTPRVQEEGLGWYQRPAVLAVVVLVAAAFLNILFW